jgi:hypothetical protein
MNTTTHSAPAGTNADRFLPAVTDFISEAQAKGCYTEAQAVNYRGAWNLVLQGVEPHLKRDPAGTTVKHVQPEIERLLRLHGNNSKVSASSIRTYKARVERLLKEFLAHNGGDFMRWKDIIERSKPTGTNGSSKKRKRPATVDHDAAQELSGESQTHPILLPSRRAAKLVLPAQMTQEEITAAWTVLDGLRHFLEAQAKALGNWEGDDD